MTERKSIERQLKSAAKSGDVGRVSELLSKGEVNLDCRDRNGSTPLHHAAGQGQIAVLKLLCRKGASMGTQNKEGQTALHEAAHQGHENCVAYLLRKGADTEHRDKDGATPLHNAAFRGHDRCVQHLIKEGANVNAIDQQGQTPAHKAALAGHIGSLMLLSSVSADIGLKDTNGSNALHKAAFGGNMACVRLLLQKGIPVDEKNANGVTPLHHAAYGGSHSCLTELLSQGANVNAVTADKGTPLHYGAVRGNHRCLQILLTHGANVNAQDKDGMTALHFAASEDYRDCVRLLLSKGAAKEILNKKGRLAKELAHSPHTMSSFLSESERARQSKRSPRKEKLSRVRSQGITTPKQQQHSERGSEDNDRSFTFHTLTRSQGADIPKDSSAGKSTTNPPTRHRRTSSSPFNATPGDPTPEQDAGKSTKGFNAHRSLSEPSLAEDSKPARRDRYGFVKRGSESAFEVKQCKKERNRSMKWVAMLADKQNWDSKKNVAKRKERTLKGIPDCVRGEAWKTITKVAELKAANDSQLYERLLTQSTKFEPEIARDLDRTYPNHIYFERQGEGQKTLFNVLKAYAIYNPKVGYCQGMGFTTGLLLMYMEEEDVFWVLVRLCNEYGLDQLYMDGFPALTRCNFVLEKLLKFYMPRVSQHLEREQLITSMYTPQWFMTVFTYNMPFSIVLRIWDVFLEEGYQATFGFAISLFKVFEEKILAKSFQALFSFLKFDPEAVEEPFPKLDPEKLLSTYKYFSGKGIAAKIKEFTEEYETKH